MSSTVQNDQYWEQFSVLPNDLEHITNFLVESERPQTIDQLAQEVIHARHHQMVALIEDTLAQGSIYRPGDSYTVGEKVIFPHLNNLLGEVIEVRPGHNPEYDEFSVIRVRMEISGTVREFTSSLTRDHPLNQATYLPSKNVAPDEIFGRHGEKIKTALRSALEKNVQFLSVGDQWFLRDLVMEMPAGQLNIAEALLDMANGGPLLTKELLAEMEVPAEISQPLQLFSLEYALLHDRRFDEVGPAGYALWYLRQMEPQGVLEVPQPLRYMPIPYNRGLLDETMLALERQIDDEWSDIQYPVSPADTVTVVLNYPHWRSGTLPLSPHVAQLFPTARVADRIRFTFMDATTKQTFPGWVVRSGRYVYGLAEWYKKLGASVGVYVDLARGDEPGVIHVELRSTRAKRREWLRTVTTESGQVLFEVTRIPVSCEFDELATVAVPDPNAVDALAQQLQRVSLEALLEQIFNGLAGLSLQRAVHAMTLYSVLNLLRRVPPAPMLAVLATSSRYVSLGDNYWAYRGES